MAQGKEPLSISQIKQIAGRAGRYRVAPSSPKVSSGRGPNVRAGAVTALMDTRESRALSYKGTVKQKNTGLVTCLAEEDLDDIHSALDSEAEPLTAAGIAPPADLIEEFASKLPQGVPYEYLMYRVRRFALLHPRYFLADLEDVCRCAALIDSVDGLSVTQSFIFTAAPVSPRTPVGRKVAQALASCVARHKPVTIADVPEVPFEALDESPTKVNIYLTKLEHLHKAIILFLWLSYRFVNIFLDQDMALHAKETVEERINSCLLGSSDPKSELRALLVHKKTKVKALDPSKSPREIVTLDAGSWPSEDGTVVPAKSSESLQFPVHWTDSRSGIQWTTKSASNEARP
jgi:ATP-dependent RNA helicase SUPV3L1/SUV3